MKHPPEAGAYILESCPIHAPRLAGDHLAILSFNDVPLPEAMVEAWVGHREFSPDKILIRWTQ